MAALLQSLAGCSAKTIANEYALTRIGIEPAREHLLAVLQAQTGVDINEPGMLEICGAKPATILKLLDLIEKRYNGVEGYLKNELSLTEEDIKKIKENLIGVV